MYPVSQRQKFQGSKYVEENVMFYSGVSQQQRASKDVAVFVKKSLGERIKSYEYISDRIRFILLKHI